MNPANTSEGYSEKMHQMKLDLLNTQAQLRQVIDLIPEFIYARDYEGRFMLVNKLAAKYMSSTPEQLEGKHYDEIGANVTLQQQHLQEDRTVIDSNEAVDIPLEKFSFPDGEVKYVRTVKVPFATNTEHNKGVLCVSYDITKYITIDHLKDEYIRQLEELAFTTSHIVRQPLTSILGIIQLLEDDAISANDLKDILFSLKEQIVNLDTRTRELNKTINAFTSKINSFPGHR